jgi:CBS domain containing-hemolysin-like protein
VEFNKKGDQKIIEVEWKDFKIEVVDMDGARIDKVIADRITN